MPKATGYSGKPLWQRLGLKPGLRYLALAAPAHLPALLDGAEDGLRAVLLPMGWLDVKVCAVDADWSALKFLRRRR